MKKSKRLIALLLCISIFATLMVACASPAAQEQPETEPTSEPEDVIDISTESSSVDEPYTEEEVYVDFNELVGYADDLAMVPLADAPSGAAASGGQNTTTVAQSAPIATSLMPVASGKVVKSNKQAEVDASNTADGYVMIRFTGGGTAKIKVIITGPKETKYTYNLNNGGKFETFPLSDGNGTYKIGVYRNVSGTQYSTSFSTSVDVKMKDEFAPFLLPNQYVNYTTDSATVKKAAELTKNCKTELEKVKAVYEFVVKTLTYDKERAANVQSGYLPNLDDVLAKKKGICFDYAALMAAMLRSQGVPCKLVVGYAGTAYHAWINTYSDAEGWVNGAIYFDGTTWKLMDPTFASSGKSSDSVMQYIGDGKNYSAKYLY